MVYCCVPFCKSGGNPKERNLSFHLFPNDEKLKREWVLRIARQGKEPGSLWEPTNKSVVCNRHFTPECFSISTTNKRLLPYTCPSIFGHYHENFKKVPGNIKNTPKKRKYSVLEEGEIIIEAKNVKYSSLPYRKNINVEKHNRRENLNLKYEGADVDENEIVTELVEFPIETREQISYEKFNRPMIKSEEVEEEEEDEDEEEEDYDFEECETLTELDDINILSMTRNIGIQVSLLNSDLTSQKSQDAKTIEEQRELISKLKSRINDLESTLKHNQIEVDP